jgi:hypothetical protein
MSIWNSSFRLAQKRRAIVKDKVSVLGEGLVRNRRSLLQLLPLIS